MLSAFADYLAEQDSVAAVHHVGIDWPGAGTEHRRRTLMWDIDLRQPMLPIRLAGGDLRWVDAEGVLLPGALSGDPSLPEIIHYERSQQADGSSPTLQVLLDIWPQLQQELSTIDDVRLARIDLDHRLDQHSDNRGIVLITDHGTKLIWGGPHEHQYGVDWVRRVAQLGHALRCQGDLRQVALVNARFSDPFAIIK